MYVHKNKDFYPIKDTKRQSLHRNLPHLKPTEDNYQVYMQNFCNQYN